MVRLPAVFEPLDQAADAVIAGSRESGIPKRREILDTLDDGLGFLGNAMGVMAWQLEDEHRGPQVLAPLHKAAAAVRQAADACREARRALTGMS
jgi:hypothetical protein